MPEGERLLRGLLLSSRTRAGQDLCSGVVEAQKCSSFWHHREPRCPASPECASVDCAYLCTPSTALYL